MSTPAQRAVTILTSNGIPTDVAWSKVNGWIQDRQPNLITEAKGFVAWTAAQ